jgi:hypothetical protein
VKNEHTWFVPLIVDSVIVEQDVVMKSFDSNKEVANKDVELKAKFPYHSLFHHNKKHK